ncbi:MAG: D-2-hydroxyacid dehydrogenase [Bacteroidota bacterium]
MNIVYLDGATLNPGDLSWAPLEALGSFTVYPATPPDLIIERSKEADIIITNKVRLSQTLLEQLPKLGYIGVSATGYDVVDLPAARAHKLIVTNVPGYGTTSVAQHVFALILSLTNHVKLHAELNSQGKWTESGSWSYWEAPLTELAGKTLGIVGVGAIGLKTAHIGRAFGMRVIGNRRDMSQQVEGIELMGIEQLFTESDIVSLHCPLTEENRELVNISLLEKMKSTALLINTARGPLINEEDLAEALRQGTIRGAGLDVLSQEPPTMNHPLQQLPTCLISPHIAWASQEARGRLLAILADNISSYLAGKPQNVVS